MDKAKVSGSCCNILVVIPVKNEEKFIKECLLSVFNQDFAKGKIFVVVVDNGSTDKTCEIVLGFGDKVTLLEHPEGTIASLRNFGACSQNSDLVAFLDGDCVAPSNWLSTGYKILMEDELVACVGFTAAKPGLNASWVARVWHDMCSCSKYSGTLQVVWVSSFNLLLRREMFLQVGGFDESLVTCEDYDLGVRLSQQYKVIFSDIISVAHLGVVDGIKEFFAKELWRGKNNLQSFIKDKFSIGSFLGVAAPVYQLVATFLFFLNFLCQLMPLWFSLIIWCIIPLLMTLRKISKMNWYNSLRIFFLYNVYLLARGLAIFEATWKK